MKHIGLCAILCAALMASGCAAGLAGSALLSNSMRESGRAGAPRPVVPTEFDSDDTPSTDSVDVYDDDADEPAPVATAEASEVTEATEAAEVTDIETATYATASDDDDGVVIVAEDHELPTAQPSRRASPRMTSRWQEPIAPPQPTAESEFKQGGDEVDIDRFQRRVEDVPLDIRPTAGIMPGNPGAAEFNGTQGSDGSLCLDGQSPIVCSWTPWIICYRPLYFEDIPLERYGRSYGILQPGVSFAKFFGTVPILPYKMTVHPPRSCICSNGFSREGDLPLPGYGKRQFRWDASLVEAAVVMGIVFILP